MAGRGAAGSSVWTMKGVLGILPMRGHSPVPPLLILLSPSDGQLAMALLTLGLSLLTFGEPSGGGDPGDTLCSLCAPNPQTSARL